MYTLVRADVDQTLRKEDDVRLSGSTRPPRRW
jgi:hypothetical protein